MPSLAFRASRLRVSAAARAVLPLVALGALAACAPAPPPAPPLPPDGFVQHAFQEFTADYLAVESLTTHKPRLRRHDTGQHYRYWLLMIPFEARVRFTRELRVRSDAEMRARSYDPAWTIEESENDLQRLMLFSAGTHAAGTKRSLRGVAVFERAGELWRSRGFLDRQPL